MNDNQDLIMKENLMNNGQIKCIVPSGDICGEAVMWNADENSIYWVDINRFLIHKYCLEYKSTLHYFFDEPVVALSLTNKIEIILVALASKIIFWNIRNDKRFESNVKFVEYPTARLNDGRTDPNGNFWIGSMANNVGPSGESIDVESKIGKLYKYRDNKLIEFESKIGISNTFCWSPDKSKFYFSDTLKNEIRVYDYNTNTATISNGRNFFKNFNRGLPDGSTIDEEGFLWNCRYGGGCIVRISPEGEVDQIVEMPVINSTTCTFGGTNLKTLYVTTARSGKRITDRLAGSLFSIETQIKGLPENKFILPSNVILEENIE